MAPLTVFLGASPLNSQSISTGTGSPKPKLSTLQGKDPFRSTGISQELQKELNSFKVPHILFPKGLAPNKREFILTVV